MNTRVVFCFVFLITLSFGVFTQSCTKSQEPSSRPLHILEPIGMAIDNSGTIYFANSTSNIIKLKANGSYIAVVDTNSYLACGGDGKLAISESTQSPYGVCVDQTGNVYFSDNACNKVHKINSSGFLVAVAGNGSIGFSGDGANATNAALNGPSGIAVDKAGDIYIADNLNNRIRKVDGSTGVITTIAGNGTPGKSGDGGPASSCELSPTNLAIDDSMNIYIADHTNYIIRKINVTTWIINTIAGNGQSSFNGDSLPALTTAIFPEFLVLDSAYNIYFTDVNNRVRKMNTKTGIINSIAGNGVMGFAGDNGPATKAELYLPTGIVLDRNGNIYIADCGNNRIRKIVLSTGIITSVAQ